MSGGWWLMVVAGGWWLVAGGWMCFGPRRFSRFATHVQEEQCFKGGRLRNPNHGPRLHALLDPAPEPCPQASGGHRLRDALLIQMRLLSGGSLSGGWVSGWLVVVACGWLAGWLAGGGLCWWLVVAGGGWWMDGGGGGGWWLAVAGIWWCLVGAGGWLAGSRGC